MNTISHRVKIISLFILIIFLGFGGIFFFEKKNAVPKEFTDAREQGAIISQNIVDLSTKSTDDLKTVNKLDDGGEYEDALTLTTKIIDQSEKLKTEATELSGEIQIMTKSLSNISDENARQAALSSISSRIALISELISYSNDLEKLLVTLQGHFTGKTVQPGEVAAQVDQINTDVNAINNFNAQAQESMQVFDKIEQK